MKIPISWLKDYVEFDLSATDLAARLNAAGLEVDGVQVSGDWGDSVVVGRVVAISPHPNADQLRLAEVEIGAGEVCEVVCGAPNLAVEQKIAFAKVGAVLFNPDTGERDFKLRKSKIRGVASAGMVCSERELGLSDEHEGILVLDNEAQVGTPLQNIVGDAVLELNPTPNRPDWFGVVGVAREIAALTGAPLRMPALDYAVGDADATDLARVAIEAPDLCLRYMAGVIQGVAVKPAPDWMQRRLRALGERPINNIVDTTNYVMFETGQPLHAFDYAAVRDGTIAVRRAAAGERLTTLDDKARTFQTDDLFITDGEKPVAVAGVMGGLGSQIEPHTSTILLEAANFNGANTRRMSQALKLRTEASLRFEKGLHPASAEFGIKRCMRLLLETAGGTAARGLVDVYPAPPAARQVRLSQKRIKYVLGVSWDDAVVEKTLGALDLAVSATGAGEWNVKVPFWRTDIAIPEDLCEELSRIIGYDTIESAPLASELPPAVSEHNEIKLRTVGACTRFGLQEVITYATTEPELDELCNRDSQNGALSLVNPVSQAHNVMRRSLRANVLKVALHNLNATQRSVAIFECGRIYGASPSKNVVEHDAVAGVLVGARGKLHWSQGRADYDFFDAKGCVETILANLSVRATFTPTENAFFADGRVAVVQSANSDVLGYVGEVAPAIAARFDIDARPLAFFELDLQKLHGVSTANELDNVRYQPIVRLPQVNRDINLVVNQNLPVADLIEVLKQPALVKDVVVFDLYEGDDLPAGKKAVALRIAYQSPAKTLNVDKVEKIQSATLRKLHDKFGAQLRSEIKP